MAFVQDNGTNMDMGKLLELEFGWHSLGCAGHTLQLCVNAGLKVNSTIEHGICAAWCLVTHFRKSEPALHALKFSQEGTNIPNHPNTGCFHSLV